MFSRLIRRLYGPVQGRQDPVPDPVRSYFAQIPSGFGKVQIGNTGPSVGVEGFRAIEGVVFAEGWSGLESWGVWSEGHQAVLYLKNPFAGHSGPPSASSPGEIIIGCSGAISESYTKLTIRFDFGAHREEFAFAWPDVSAQISLPVPSIHADEEILRLTLQIKSPLSPYERTNGVSPDHRRLGIGVKSIEFRRGQCADLRSFVPADQLEEADAQPQYAVNSRTDAKCP